MMVRILLVVIFLGGLFLLVTWIRAQNAESRAYSAEQQAQLYQQDLSAVAAQLRRAREALEVGSSRRQVGVADILGCGAGGDTAEFLRRMGVQAASVGSLELGGVVVGSWPVVRLAGVTPLAVGVDADQVLSDLDFADVIEGQHIPPVALGVAVKHAANGDAWFVGCQVGQGIVLEEVEGELEGLALEGALEILIEHRGPPSVRRGWGACYPGGDRRIGRRWAT